MVEGPVTGKRLKRRTIRNIIITVSIAVIALILITAGLYIYNSMVEKVAQKKAAQLEQTVSNLSTDFNTTVSNSKNQLKDMAADNKVIGLFEAADESALSAAADTMLVKFESGLKLRFLLPGQYTTDNTSKPPLGFASLDLLKNAEQGKAPTRAEVHMLGNPNEHVVLIERVNNAAGELIGLIHLSLAVDLYKGPLDKLVVKDGYVELQQTIGGKKITLGKRGDGNLKQGEPIYADIKGSTWRLYYWSGADVSEAQAGSGAGLLYGLIALVIIVAAAAGWWFLRGSRGAPEPEGEAVVYQGAVKAIMEGAHPGVESLIPGLPDSGQPNQVTPLSQGLDTDDATVIFDTAEPAESLIVVEEQAAEAPAASQQADQAQPPKPTAEIARSIFRAYDIRGVVGETFTAEAVESIGRAIGSEATELGLQGVAVGRDGRTHSPELAEALIKGIRASGQDVIDIGMVPTPVLYFATHYLEASSGVMLTGSHNGPEYNGLKVVIGGNTLSGDAIAGLYERITKNNLSTGQGSLQTVDIGAEYIRRISEDIPVALGNSFKLVVDAGNGIAGNLAPQLYRALGHDVVELYCDVDGNFPNHHPDPSQPENLQDLIAKVKQEQADLGFAFDGDGDRLGVVDAEGNIIWPDRQLMLLAKDVLSRNQGAPIIFDVKCSRYLKATIESCGGQALMWKTGHSLIKSKMKELESPLAGEMSGHIFFKERWYGFDDALYTGARMLEVLTNSKSKPTEVFATIPEGVSTPELRIKLEESKHAAFMKILMDKTNFEGAEITDIDGLRADFSDGWGLIRPSNTSPYLVLRFEAENQTALERIQGLFRAQILAVKSDLELPF